MIAPWPLNTDALFVGTSGYQMYSYEQEMSYFCVRCGTPAEPYSLIVMHRTVFTLLMQLKFSCTLVCRVETIFIGDTIVRRYPMKFKKRESPLSALLGTGLYLLENLRGHLPNDVDDIKGRAKETYETASDRLGNAADALCGKEDSHIFGNVSALLIGVGIVPRSRPANRTGQR